MLNNYTNDICTHFIMEEQKEVLGFSTHNEETVVVAKINGRRRVLRLRDARICMTQEMLAYLETRLEWQNASPEPPDETPSPTRHPTRQTTNQRETPRCSRSRPPTRRPPRHGFDRGLEPKKVLGATRLDGKLLLLMQWNGSADADLIPADEVYTRCPQLALDFYLERLKFADE